MDFRELKRIQQLMKQIKAINHLKKVMRDLKGREKEEAVEDWLREHRQAMKELDEQELNQIREQTDYDQSEWEKLIQKIQE